MFLKKIEKAIEAEGFGSYLDPVTKHRLINAPPINDFVKDLTPDSVAKDRQKRAKSFLQKLGEKIIPEEADESFEVNLEIVEPTKNLPHPTNKNNSYPQEALWWQKAIATSVSTYIHGSPEDKPELVVKAYGHSSHGHDFGGVFLSNESKMGHIGSGSQHWYYIELSDDEVLDLHDVWYEKDIKDPKIKKVLKKFLNLKDLSEEQLDSIWAAICERYNYIPTEVEDVFDGWTCQTIQGQIAKELGYRAVKLTDERGQVFLLPGPAVLKRLDDDSWVEGQIAIAKTVSRSDIATECHLLLKKYFGDLGSFPVPQIEIVNNPKSKWLGRCVYKSNNKANTVIKLQRTILGDEKSLRRILAHELIHHVDFLLNWSDKDLRHYRQDGHGEFFQERAAKINAIEGANFVSKTSDENIIESLDKEITLLIIPRDDRLLYQWTFRPSMRQKQRIENQIKNHKARLAKSKEIKFALGRQIGTKWLSAPSSQELKDKLQELYDQGAQEIF